MESIFQVGVVGALSGLISGIAVAFFKWLTKRNDNSTKSEIERMRVESETRLKQQEQTNTHTSNLIDNLLSQNRGLQDELHATRQRCSQLEEKNARLEDTVQGQQRDITRLNEAVRILQAAASKADVVPIRPA